MKEDAIPSIGPPLKKLPEMRCTFLFILILKHQRLTVSVN
jgi:hypothetical protein